jgi:hypothetical protein
MDLSASSLIHDSFERIDGIRMGILVGKEGDGIRQKVHAYIQKTPTSGRSVWEFEQRKMLGSGKASRNAW